MSAITELRKKQQGLFLAGPLKGYRSIAAKQ